MPQTSHATILAIVRCMSDPPSDPLSRNLSSFLFWQK